MQSLIQSVYNILLVWYDIVYSDFFGQCTGNIKHLKATTNLKVMLGMIMLEQSLLCYKSDITQKYSPEAS